MVDIELEEALESEPTSSDSDTSKVCCDGGINVGVLGHAMRLLKWDNILRAHTSVTAHE